MSSLLYRTLIFTLWFTLISYSYGNVSYGDLYSYQVNSGNTYAGIKGVVPWGHESMIVLKANLNSYELGLIGTTTDTTFISKVKVPNENSNTLLTPAMSIDRKHNLYVLGLSVDNSETTTGCFINKHDIDDNSYSTIFKLSERNINCILLETSNHDQIYLATDNYVTKKIYLYRLSIRGRLLEKQIIKSPPEHTLRSLSINKNNGRVLVTTSNGITYNMYEYNSSGKLRFNSPSLDGLVGDAVYSKDGSLFVSVIGDGSLEYDSLDCVIHHFDKNKIISSAVISAPPQYEMFRCTINHRLFWKCIYTSNIIQ
ncbi:MAG: hypothetical protein K2X04_09630 [Burkholderiales bacterium]|nr:hypothetical protein [Burkholderiales bacterium]